MDTSRNHPGGFYQNGGDCALIGCGFDFFGDNSDYAIVAYNMSCLNVIDGHLEVKNTIYAHCLYEYDTSTGASRTLDADSTPAMNGMVVNFYGGYINNQESGGLFFHCSKANFHGVQFFKFDGDTNYAIFYPYCTDLRTESCRFWKEYGSGVYKSWTPASAGALAASTWYNGDVAGKTVVIGSLDAAGRIKLTNTAFPGEISANAYLYSAADLGLVIYGAGSNTDVLIANKNGGTALKVLTGDNKALFPGGIGVGNAASGDVTGTAKTNKIQVFDSSGASLGYIQVYAG